MIYSDKTIKKKINFIKKAKKKHKNKYEYTKVIYSKQKDKIIIICKIHGEFEQTPESHLFGKGCKKCGIDIRKKKQTMSLDEFIKRANIKHNDKYDYSKTIYIKSCEKIIIICNGHGEFKQTPNGHLRGQGCKKCATEKTAKQCSMTLEQFILKSNLKHNNKYDYSKVNYIAKNIKIIIICPQHGEFLQQPQLHLNGHGCVKCSANKNSKKKALSITDFIIRANEKHNNEYDYSKVIYDNLKKKIIIICSKHGEFSQTPNNHLFGKGCKKCGVEKRTTKRTMTLNEFIEKANNIHNNKYNYSKAQYTKSRNKIIIICKLHGEFQQIANTHLMGAGCVKCSTEINALKNSLTQEEFLIKANEAHNNKYDYSKAIYKNNDEKIIIICSEHGEFLQKCSNHFYGKGCKKCGINIISEKLSLTQEEFLNKSNNIHYNKYDYSKTIYKKGRDKIIIICPKHGEFLQAAESHLSGCGCPLCKSSKGELFIENYLKTNNYEYLTQHKFPDCKNIYPLPFDFYLPKLNILIEFDGEQHERPVNYFGGIKAFDKLKINDNIKNDYAKTQNIKLVRIKYKENIIEKLEDFLNHN